MVVTKGLSLNEIKATCATINLLLLFFGMSCEILNKIGNVGCIVDVFLLTCWPMCMARFCI